MALGRHYAKLPSLADFDDPELQRCVAEVAPSLFTEGPHRKAWEWAMGVLFLRDVGKLGDCAEILDVGAGSEPILFWLANHARRVVGVDIYGSGSFGSREASAGFMEDPSGSAPYEYRRERLEVLDMDARHLDFPDAPFDAVVSFSSIEHFGSAQDIARAAREIGRVLKPGGHAFIVTEVFVDRHTLDRAPVLFAIRLATLGRRCGKATPRRRSTGEMFSARELRKLVIEPSGLKLMQRLDLRPDPETRTNIHLVHADGTTTPSGGRAYPHVLLRTELSTFTSVCLPLVKPAAA